MDAKAKLLQVMERDGCKSEAFASDGTYVPSSKFQVQSTNLLTNLLTNRRFVLVLVRFALFLF